MGDSIKALSSSLTSLALGQLVGYGSEVLSSKVEAHRIRMGIDDNATDSMFDVTLDIFVELAFLLLGISFVEKAVPAVSADLSSMLMFDIGLITALDKFPRNLRSMKNKLSS